MAARAARNAPTAARSTLGLPAGWIVPWSRFLRELRWRQGEHMTFVGTTGSGKTTLAMTLLPLRAYRCIICVKPADALMRRVAREDGYSIETTWPPRGDSDRVILWPPNKGARNLDEQADTVSRALDDLYSEGRWAVYLDELEWLTNNLNLEGRVNVMWQHGRSLGLSLVTGAQRPRHVPMLAYDQATHLFLYRNNDRYNRKRMGELGGMDVELIEHVIARLPRHVFCYVNTRDGTIRVSRNPSKG